MGKEAGGQCERESTRVWYFAYGSNMSPITLGRRRPRCATQNKMNKINKLSYHKIKFCRAGRRRPSESVAGVLEGHRLLFDFVGVPFFEPSFANIAPEKGCCVHGVLHLLTARHVQKHSCRLMVVVVVVEGAHYL